MARAQTVLLAEAVRYALGTAALVDRRQLTAATPCPGWDLAGLLTHLAGSMASLDRALTGTPLVAGPVAADPVELLRDRAAGLLWTAFATEDRTGTVAPLVAVGAIEIAVHGWDAEIARGVPGRIPPELARPLLRYCPRLTAGRSGRFGPPLPMPRCASPGDMLVAWLGRDPAISYRRVA
jgi:uncharacterized protein (TIGR03086 family)